MRDLIVELKGLRLHGMAGAWCQQRFKTDTVLVLAAI